PNIVGGRGIVAEFIQRDATPEAVAGAPLLLLEDDVARAAQRAALMEVRTRLGEAGAGLRAARRALPMRRQAIRRRAPGRPGGARAPGRAGRRSAHALATSRPIVALGRGFVRLLARSLRIREFPSPGLQAIWRAGTPVIYTVWHGQILLLPYLYGRRFPIHALTSRSRAGETLGRFGQGFGIRVVRGSSSRGGARALLSLTRVIRDLGENVLIVPDGPRGPRQVAQNGAVLLAKMTGVPMVPLAF